MARVPDPTLGDFLRTLNEAHGVAFYLGYAVGAIEERCIRLGDGAALDADPVLVGIGVRPRLALVEKAGLAVGRGVLIDEDLVASAPDVFAASDIARRPEPYGDEWLRIEH